MLYSINLKNIKRSATLVEDFLTRKNSPVSRTMALDIVAQCLHVKNYNTLEAIATSPDNLRNYKEEKKYLFEIEISCSKEELVKIIQSCQKQSNMSPVFDNFIEKGHHYYFEISAVEEDHFQNFLTNLNLVLFLPTKNYKITRYEYYSVIVTKHDMMKSIVPDIRPKVVQEKPVERETIKYVTQELTDPVKKHLFHDPFFNSLLSMDPENDGFPRKEQLSDEAKRKLVSDLVDDVRKNGETNIFENPANYQKKINEALQKSPSVIIHGMESENNPEKVRYVSYKDNIDFPDLSEKSRDYSDRKYK